MQSFSRETKRLDNTGILNFRFCRPNEHPGAATHMCRRGKGALVFIWDSNSCNFIQNPKSILFAQAFLISGQVLLPLGCQLTTLHGFCIGVAFRSGNHSHTQTYMTPQDRPFLPRGLKTTGTGSGADHVTHLPEVKSRPFTPPNVESDTKTGTVHAITPNSRLPKICTNKGSYQRGKGS